MNKPYSVLFQKDSELLANDSVDKWGIACRSFPFEVDGGAKELASRDWPGEDGEDTFFPDRLALKAYDLQAEMVYVGELGSAYDALVAFRDYLTGEDGKGTELMIYNSHTGIGRRACHWLEMGDISFNKGTDEDVLQFTLKIRVTDPRTRVNAIVNKTTNTCNLTASII